MLFRDKTITNSEEFVFPNIETVKITIEGTPSRIYSQGIPQNRSNDKAKRLFGKAVENPLITPKFLQKSLCIIDLCNVEDNNVKDNVYQTGRKLTSTQSGIQLETKKRRQLQTQTVTSSSSQTVRLRSSATH